MLSPYKQIGYGVLLTGGLVAAMGSAGCASSGRQPVQVASEDASARKNLQELVSEMEYLVKGVAGISQKERLHIFDSASNTNYEVSSSLGMLSIDGEVEGKKVTYFSKAIGSGLFRVIIGEGEGYVQITPEHILSRFGDRIEDTNKTVWDTREAIYHRLLRLAYGEAKSISTQESQKAKPLADKINR